VKTRQQQAKQARLAIQFTAALAVAPAVIAVELMW
jgi:hypothetical protein